MGKAFADMPGAFKAFIDQYFKSIDVDGNYKNQNNRHSMFGASIFKPQIS